jgi:hypothetical protein
VTEGGSASASEPYAARGNANPGKPGSPRGVRNKWRELSFEKQLSILLAPLLVALVSGILVPRVNELFFGETNQPSLKVIDLVVYNQVAKYEQLESRGEAQTKDSVPSIEVILHNTGNRRSVITRASVTIKDRVSIEPCFTPNAELRISGNYDIELPTKSRIGQTIEVPVSQQLGADEADRFIFRFGSPVHYHYPGVSRGAFVYWLGLSLRHDNEKDPLNVGSVVLSVPGLPEAVWTKDLAAGGPNIDPIVKDASIRRCLQTNTAAIRPILARSGERSSELVELAASLA